MLTPSQDGRGSSAGTLESRYGRVLSLGDVLDESIRLFRLHWITFASVSAVGLLPPGLLIVGLSAAGVFSSSVSLAEFQSGRFSQAATPTGYVPALFAYYAVSALFYCIWSAAITATTEAYLRGGEPSVARVYRRALRRFLTVLLGSVLFVLGLTALSALAFIPFTLTLFGSLGSIISAVALLVWWLNKGARKGWLKWLIVLCVPFGLPIYFAMRWSMFVAAAVLEHRGPLAALQRSSELVSRHGFRVMAILTVTSVIVGVLLYAPASLIQVPFFILAATRGQFGLSPAETAISGGAIVVLQILFQSVGVIAYTLMFMDLRNRREGTDLAERLTQLEASPITAGG